MAISVFVYGTLQPGQCNYSAYCEGHQHQIQRGYIYGKIYHLPPLGYPGVTAGGDRVWGYCLTFGPDFFLGAIDDLEGYDPRRSPEENEYHRTLTPIFDPQGNPFTTAWVYWMTPATITQYQGIYLPAGHWPTP